MTPPSDDESVGQECRGRKREVGELAQTKRLASFHVKDHFKIAKFSVETAPSLLGGKADFSVQW